MTMYPSHDDWVYTAGLVDGEGSITIGTSKKRWAFFSIRLSVAMTNQNVITWLHDVFGGTLMERQPLFPRKRYWIWYVDGNAAVPILHRLQPMLKVKAAQAWLAQEAWANKEDGRRVGGVGEEQKALRIGYALAGRYLNQGGAV